MLFVFICLLFDFREESIESRAAAKVRELYSDDNTCGFYSGNLLQFVPHLDIFSYSDKHLSPRAAASVQAAGIGRCLRVGLAMYQC